MNSWIKSPHYDFWLFLFPGLFSIILLFVGNELHLFPTEMNPMWWIVSVLFVDVAHVWSSLFKTYFNSNAYEEFRKELILIPLIGWGLMAATYAAGPHYFWRILAYIAVFHFIKQQVGFVKIYGRKEKRDFWYQFDIVYTYYITFLPILYWHIYGRSFSWFIEGDFLSLSENYDQRIFLYPYYFLSLIFLGKEVVRRTLNWPKLMTIMSTQALWYFGIIFYNNDWSFTVSNTIHHGIPYMGLVWINSMIGKYKGTTRFISKVMEKNLKVRLLFFVTFLGLISYAEELLWDIFVWQENATIFGEWGEIELSQVALVLLVPLLTLPQFTHYILDRYIWRSDRKVDDFSF